MSKLLPTGPIDVGAYSPEEELDQTEQDIADQWESWDAAAAAADREERYGKNHGY